MTGKEWIRTCKVLDFAETGEEHVKYLAMIHEEVLLGHKLNFYRGDSVVWNCVGAPSSGASDGELIPCPGLMRNLHTARARWDEMTSAECGSARGEVDKIRASSCSLLAVTFFLFRKIMTLMFNVASLKKKAYPY